jgi:DNA-binding NarL/FixJ family response regulator
MNIQILRGWKVLLKKVALCGQKESAMTIRVLIADDHTVMCEGLKMLLGLDQEIEVVGEASNGQQALELARQLKPEVVLMDLLMPVMNGIEATALIHKELPQTQVLALTSVLEEISALEAVKAGAIGYLLKDKQATEVRQAVKAAARGEAQFSAQMVAHLVQEVQQPEAALPPKAHLKLTKREEDVLKLLVLGYANKHIASELGLLEGTVKTHVGNILAKLEVETRTQAAYKAFQLGLVEDNNSEFSKFSAKNPD